ncbi:MAG: ASPIC/UnbV domain-containing protein [Acidobacteria bacterium]|nr:ASPIC/UnbV domain-containing protein [Acidobacteriota bacterium]
MGARPQLRTGSQWQVCEVRRGDSYLRGHDPHLHFGLGKTAQVDEIQILWPSGATLILRDVPAN